MKGHPQLCLHEAGHAIAALEHNIRFSTVSATTNTSHVSLIPEAHNKDLEVPVRASAMIITAVGRRLCGAARSQRPRSWHLGRLGR